MPGPQRRGTGAGAGGNERRGGGRDRDNRRGDAAEKTAYVERVVTINRVAKVVKGGRRFSFSALVVVGDQHGYVGAGLGKANEVPEAIRKGTDRAKRNLFKIPLIKGTIPHDIEGFFGAAQVLFRPASPGTGVIAGGAVRPVLEVAGITDILTKSIGTSNKHNVIHATIVALKALRSVDQVAKTRGKNVSEFRGVRTNDLRG